MKAFTVKTAVNFFETTRWSVFLLKACFNLNEKISLLTAFLKNWRQIFQNILLPFVKLL